MTPGGQAAAPRWAVLAAFATVYVIWGSTYLAIRFAIETLPPFLMAGTRFLVAGGVLYAALRLRGGERPSRRHWGGALVIGTLLLFGGNGGVVWAEQFVASGLAALMVATVPLWMVLLDWARPGGPRPGRATWLGLAAGFVGVALLVGDDLDGAGVPWLPAVVLLLASGSWAFGSLLSRRVALPASPLLATAMEMLTGGAVLLVVGLASGEAAALEVERISARSLLGLAYLILFGAILAFSAYVWLLRVSTPARVSTYAYVNPVIAVLLGALLAGEPLTPRIGVAALLIVGAVFAVAAARRAPAPPVAADGRRSPVVSPPLPVGDPARPAMASGGCGPPREVFGSGRGGR